MSMILKVITASTIFLTCASVQADELRGSIASEAAGGASWSGYYVGVGVAYGSYSDTDGRFPGVVSSGDDVALSIHAGANHQIDDFVIGLEADLTQLDSSFKVLPAPLAASRLRVNTVVSLKARAGYAFDKFLPYATAGLGYAKTNIAGLDGYGWVAGVGVDYKVQENLLFGVQYVHHRYNEFGGAPIIADFDLFTARLSLKY